VKCGCRTRFRVGYRALLLAPIVLVPLPVLVSSQVFAEIEFFLIAFEAPFITAFVFGGVGFLSKIAEHVRPLVRATDLDGSFRQRERELSPDQKLQLPLVTLSIVVVQATLFALSVLQAGSLKTSFQSPVVQALGLVPDALAKGEFWRLLAYPFISPTIDSFVLAMALVLVTFWFEVIGGASLFLRVYGLAVLIIAANEIAITPADELCVHSGGEVFVAFFAFIVAVAYLGIVTGKGSWEGRLVIGIVVPTGILLVLNGGGWRDSYDAVGVLPVVGVSLVIGVYLSLAFWVELFIKKSTVRVWAFSGLAVIPFVAILVSVSTIG
jgi:hypothetical protein